MRRELDGATDQRMRILLAALVLAACDQPEDVRSDVVPIHYLPELRQHPQETLDEASEILGLELELQESPEGGAVVLYLHQPEGGLDGATETIARCSPVAWARDSPLALAHELGHALGIGHELDPHNLMADPVIDDELTDEQVDVMRRTAWWLLNKCDRPEK